MDIRQKSGKPGLLFQRQPPGMMSTRSPSSVGSARGPDFMQSMERADKRHKKLLTVRERNVLHSNPLPLCLRLLVEILCSNASS